MHLANPSQWEHARLGSEAAVRKQILAPRHGVMPAWKDRLDPVTIKMLSAYVYSLGGGEKGLAPANEGAVEGQGADGQP